MLLLVAGVAACSSPVDLPPVPGPLHRGEVVAGVSLSVAGTSFAVPSKAAVTLINQSNREVVYNACLSTHERRVGSTWKPVTPFRICTLEGYILKPGRHATFEESISEEWTPGEYRISLMVSAGSGRQVTVTTGAFTVTE